MIKGVVLSMLSDSDIRERLGPLTDPTPRPDQTPGPSAGRIAALVVLVILLWGAGVAVIVHLERTSPRVPEPASGHVYRFSDTRHTVYLTAREHYVAWGAIGVPILSTVGVALFGFRRKRRPTVE
jgi:protein-S-isoprenylcysteine O-methyltransferase Ste14